MNRTHTGMDRIRGTAWLAGAIALSAGSAFAQSGTEYELLVVEPFYDGSSSESVFERVLDNGLAWGTSTVLTELPNGNFSVTNRDVTWSREDGPDIVPVNAINNRGDRVIESPNLLWATVEYTDGGYDRINAFVDDVALWAWDINESAMVVGSSINQGQIAHGILRDAFYWTPESGIVNLKSTGLVPDAGQAWSVNDSGEIVGVAGNGFFANNQAFYFDSDAQEHIDLHDLLVDPSNPGVRSDAYDINNDGVVVGSRDTGFGGDVRAFSWSRIEGATLLPGAMTAARAINDSGTIVGGSWRYKTDDGLVDLNTLADTGNFAIVEALDISNTGIIVGWGRRDGSPRATAFMLVPTQSLCSADMNLDGALDFFDVSMFLQNQTDWNGDGSFDFFDVSSFLQELGAGCP